MLIRYHAYLLTKQNNYSRIQKQNRELFRNSINHRKNQKKEKSDSESEDNEEIVECAVQELDKPNKNGRVYTKDAIINEDE